MKRGINSIEHEIVHQILISELCFEICKSISIIPGRGADFLPFYYNLNFIKGIISLHGLIASEKKDELSIKNYVGEYKRNYPNVKIADFEDKIITISKSYKKIPSLQLSLRHKIAAHIDEAFRHTDFVCAYIMPDSASKYHLLVKQLKDTFFEFCNYSQNDDPFFRIREQSGVAIDSILSHDLQ